MNWFVSALITGAVAFSATNIDDIVFLTIFFSQVSHSWHVVIGQYLGLYCVGGHKFDRLFWWTGFTAWMASALWCRPDSNWNQKAVRHAW
jgi:hypothetical protein